MKNKCSFNPLIFLSALGGLFFGLITFIILIFVDPKDAFIFSILSGLLFCLLLLWTLVISSKISDKKYLEFEKNMNKTSLAYVMEKHITSKCF